MGARKLFIRTCHPVVPAVVLHEEGGVGKTYAGVFASQQRRTQGSVEVLYAVGAVERENFIQPIQSLAIVGVHGHSYRIAETPFAMCTRRLLLP